MTARERPEDGGECGGGAVCQNARQQRLVTPGVLKQRCRDGAGRSCQLAIRENSTVYVDGSAARRLNRPAEETRAESDWVCAYH
jgi:hypothetical protein